MAATAEVTLPAQQLPPAEAIVEVTPDDMEGSAPGASEDHMLIAAESYEDINVAIDEQYQRGKVGDEKDKGKNEIEQSVRKLSIDDRSTTPSDEGRETPKEEVSAEGKERSNSMLGNRDRPQHVEEECYSPEWRQRQKHVFILSEAGKPIYTRHGNEDKLVTTMGVMQALVSFVQDNDDNIRFMIAGSHKFVFLNRPPVILVCVAHSAESTQQLLLHLTYVYNQIISVLTFSQLSKIFEKKRNYDLRRLLTGTEKFLDNLINLMDRDAMFLLSAVRCLPLASSIRDIIGQSIAQAKAKDLVFAILVGRDNQLVTVVRMKEHSLHPADLHLVFNLVDASTSFQSAESWTPICLPKFNSNGYLHAHVSYLDEECSACLLLLSADRDVFFELSEARQKIVTRLNKYGCLQAVRESLSKGSYKVAQIGIPDLRHFMYKSKSTAQYTSSELEAPYMEEGERHRLFGMYQYLHHRVHNSARPLKILFHVGSKETMLGWITSGFELYATFGPLVTKPAAINAINKLLRWIKKEEDRLFILNSYTY
ncbi:PREDICTED: vacuolar fusion protein MON1 homolog A-like isoform X2 [Branchiostoma belcheri]|uniref:Vacuolar fusion protein MON1 homolog n=1 Tax=Branchiostoma belcheri TaxID=7741 RepID=A0A6P4YY40_BRABE|nr:PREDICTED: vacuolar fusion protein MON1 homolog A-like isoform X1 [Branchiostoma belcheri]XP_019634271.1 PREDICTED: vacuolar fusion protein MON1 homolog A-like isoform X2 [Branchiostoma belcheri]